MKCNGISKGKFIKLLVGLGVIASIFMLIASFKDIVRLMKIRSM